MYQTLKSCSSDNKQNFPTISDLYKIIMFAIYLILIKILNQIFLSEKTIFLKLKLIKIMCFLNNSKVKIKTKN